MLSIILYGLLSGITFVGCAGAELLDEIPRDFALVQEAGVAKDESEGQAPEHVEAVRKQEAAKEHSFLMEETFPFAYESLSEEEKVWYRDIERILGSYGADVELKTEGLDAGLEEKDIDKIFQCVMCDHPELFYVEGYSYTKYMRGERITSITFTGTYNVDLETAVGREQEIREAAGELLAGVGEDASDYDKVKYVYDTLIRNTEYDMDSSDNQNIYSVFVHHLSVCQGYAKATQYLLNKLGVECTLVQGTVRTGEGHAWNLVKVDGEYYYVDTTWGDVSYQSQEPYPRGGEGTWQEGRSVDMGMDLSVKEGRAITLSEEDTLREETFCAGREGDSEGWGNVAWNHMPEVNYDYLNVTTQEILKTHTIGSEIPMPLCTAVEANYYRREGALFSSYDREQMSNLFEEAMESGRRDVTVKCVDDECFAQVYGALIDGQEIFAYLKEGTGSVAYAKNENQFSLTFWVTSE